MLDLAPEHLNVVHALLKEHLPGCKVFAFGSRVKGTARRFSDLDIAVDTGTAIPWSTLGELKEALSDSDLPMKVDVVDLNNIGDRFRELVLRTAIPLTHAPST